jgi:hypothetical protein
MAVIVCFGLFLLILVGTVWYLIHGEMEQAKRCAELGLMSADRSGGGVVCVEGIAP